ncbi:unnamed protein product [Arctogadus glacialis]
MPERAVRIPAIHTQHSHKHTHKDIAKHALTFSPSRKNPKVNRPVAGLWACHSANQPGPHPHLGTLQLWRLHHQRLSGKYKLAQRDCYSEIRCTGEALHLAAAAAAGIMQIHGNPRRD